jgi:hypothetical protein
VTTETPARERERESCGNYKSTSVLLFLSHYQIINVLGIRALRESEEEEFVRPFFVVVVVVASLLFSIALCHKFG